MAPRFKKNRYQTYKKEGGVDARLYFCDSGRWYQDLCQFRERLTEAASKVQDLVILRSEPGHFDIDVRLRLIEKEDEKAARDALAQKPPGILASILGTKKFGEYLAKDDRISMIAHPSLSTSHDHPCIEVHRYMHSEEDLSRLIEDISKELDIEMPKNSNLGSMASIIRSNRWFD
jgi:hypothetical protein